MSGATAQTPAAKRRAGSVEMPFTVMADALEHQRIDAAMIGEPIVSAARERVEFLGDAYGAIAPNVLIGLWVATKAFAGENPDTVQRFTRAMADTARWANAHHAETAKILAAITSIDQSTIDRMTRQTFAQTIDPKYVEPMLDDAFKYGIIGSPLKPSDLIKQ